MYELVTGTLPFRGENAVEIALKQMKEPIPSVKEFDESIPQSVENIILKSCAKNPKNRYDSARDMYYDLCKCLDEENLNEEKIKYQYPEFDEQVEKLKNEEKHESEELEIKKVDNKKENNNKFAWILGTIIGVIVILGISLFIFLPIITKVPDVKIPDVSNKSVVEAEKILEEAGFNVSVTIKDIYSDKVEEGLVVKTDPAANRTIKKGSTITIYQSKGSEKIVIEDYTDKNIYEIKAKLELLGLSVTIESKDVEDVSLYEDKEDVIIDQSPKEGELNKGDQVILYYPNIVVYPDLTTYTLEEVQAFAEKYELTLYIEEVETDSVSEGTIISQNRRVDSLIVRGAELTIKIAVKPKSENETIPSNPDITDDVQVE